MHDLCDIHVQLFGAIRLLLYISLSAKIKTLIVHLVFNTITRILSVDMQKG